MTSLDRVASIRDYLKGKNVDMQHLHLKRFFCEAGNEDHIIRDDVFIVAGEHLGVTNVTGKYAGVSQPWEQYASARSIVLL